MDYDESNYKLFYITSNYFYNTLFMTTLGTKIRKLRELKNLKQEDMAENNFFQLIQAGNKQMPAFLSNVQSG